MVPNKKFGVLFYLIKAEGAQRLRAQVRHSLIATCKLLCTRRWFVISKLIRNSLRQGF